MSSYPQDITPEQVLALEGPTTGFMCPLSANTYGIDFIDFEIKDGETNRSLFRVQKDPNAPPLPLDMPDLDPETEAMFRTIKYSFPPEFLRFQSVRNGPRLHPVTGSCPTTRTCLCVPPGSRTCTAPAFTAQRPEHPIFLAYARSRAPTTAVFLTTHWA
jgi:hypothetical protein